MISSIDKYQKKADDGCDKSSRFLYCDSEDWSLVFDVFSFEVCADVFAGFGAGWSEKNDFGQLLPSGGQNRFYLLEIIRVVGGDSQLSAGL